MNRRWLPVRGSSLLTALNGPALAGETKVQQVRMAEIEIAPAQVEDHRAALRKEIEASIRVKPGVWALYAVHEKGNPGQVRILTIYADADAYEAHAVSPCFVKYEAATQGMVSSLKLVETAPHPVRCEVEMMVLGAGTRVSPPCGRSAPRPVRGACARPMWSRP